MRLLTATSRTKEVIMTTRLYSDERRWVNSDPAMHCNGTERSKDVRWRNAWIYCLKRFDYDAAELIVSRNLVSDECQYDDHDLCHFSWCACPHHSAVQFRAEHPGVKSLSEVASELEEAEYV